MALPQPRPQYSLRLNTLSIAKVYGIKGSTWKMAERTIRPGFYRVELFKTVWEVPERYQDLSPIGTGAYGTVWYVVRQDFQVVFD